MDREKRILVVDDEEVLIDSLLVALSAEGYRVLIARDGLAALECVRRDAPDLVLLDWMLPGRDGLEVCRAIRQETAIPVIMLTARDQEVDKIVGLELGADDYITKPFSLRELLARIRAALRRTTLAVPRPGPPVPLRFGRLTIDLKARRVLLDGRELELRPKEFRLLEVLVTHPDTALSREFLIERVWGDDFMGDDKTLEVHIWRLRNKIEPDPGQPRYLTTLRGAGYRWTSDASESPS